jgi:argininosuccinate lyase
MSVLAMLKGLPFAYNRDLQEDKEPFFDSLDTLFLVIPAVSGMIATTEFDREKMKLSAPTGFSLATEIADYLAKKGVTFAEAHEVAGNYVKYCESNGLELHQMPKVQLSKLHPALLEDLFEFLTVEKAVKSRDSIMGTAPSSVAASIRDLDKSLEGYANQISLIRSRFSGMISE